MRRRFMNNNGINIDNYFTVEPTVDGFTASLSNYCEYCVNGDGKWKKLPANTETKKIPAGHTLSFKRIGATAGKFSFNGRCNVKGNIMSLLFGDAAAENISLVGYPKAFSYLFYGNAIIDASELILPATTLADSCYSSMFYNCQFLMNAPELPATTLADSCYSSMFYGCTKLNYIKMLATDISAPACLNYWVHKVASSGTFVKNPNMTSLPTGRDGIPSGWTVVNDGED